MNEQLKHAMTVASRLSDDDQDALARFALKKIEEILIEESIDDAEVLAALKHAQQEAKATRPASEFFEEIER